MTKRRRIIRLASAFMIQLGILPYAQAGGGSFIGNGGNSVVCFSIPLDQAIRDGVITDQGLKNIQSAMVLEFYLATLKTDTESPFLSHLRAGKDDLCSAGGKLERMRRSEREIEPAVVWV